MVFSRKYSRNFISLNQESSAYNYDFRSCMGRCIVEIKNGDGKLSVSVQGLKPQVPYKLCLLSVKDDRVRETCAGNLDIDESGKCEVKWHFNPDNVNNSNMLIEEFNVLAIIVKNGAEIFSPLVGYTDGEIYWKDRYTASLCEDIENRPMPLPELNSSPAYDPKPNANAPTNPSMPSMPSKPNMPNMPTNKPATAPVETPADRPMTIPEFGGTPAYTPNPNNQALTEYERGRLDEIKGLLDTEKGLLDRQRGLLEIQKGKLDEQLGTLDYKKGKLNEEQGLLNRNDPDFERKFGEIEYQKGKIDELRGKISYQKGKIDEAFRDIDYRKGKIDELKGILDYGAGRLEEEFWRNKARTSSTGDSVDAKNVELEDKNADKYTDFNDLIKKFKNDMLELEKLTLTESDFAKKSATLSKNTDIDYIKLKNPSMSPFEDEDESTSWYRISPYELTALGENMWSYINNQFVYSCFKKYKHLMLGIKRDGAIESYLLAVPCQFSKDFVANGELAGFDKFVPINKSDNGQIAPGSAGYRILAID